MRVAIVNQFSSAGGGSRFARALVVALATADPASTFDLYADARAIHRDGLVDLLAPLPNARIVPLGPSGSVVALESATGVPLRQTVREWALRYPVVVRAYRWFKGGVLGRGAGTPSLRLPEATCRLLDSYDVVYLAWPYFIEPFAVRAPIVATFHDFNFKHGFGNFSAETLETIERDMHGWLTSPVQPVSSSRFIADELCDFYPDHQRDPKVVYLSTFAVHDPSRSEVSSVRERYSLPARYIVCPSNTAPHKNLSTLFEALGRLKRQGVLTPLVLTGFGTDDLHRLARGNRELRAMYESTYKLHEVRVAEGLVLDEDVFALGYVSDLDMDALIRGAEAVVAPSCYEAGSGPAVDAWKLGTLVVSSDIPPVLQQLDFLGTRAYVFDPDDPDGMAEVIASALADDDTKQAMIADSVVAMNNYTWTDVARGYLEVFRDAVAERKR